MTGAVVLIVIGVALAVVSGIGLTRTSPGIRVSRRSAGRRARSAMQLYLGAVLVAIVGGTWMQRYVGFLGVPLAVVPVVVIGAVPILLHNRRLQA
jgi:hypothetical protein